MLMKLWWCDKGYPPLTRKGGRREGHQFTGHSSLLEGKTQNSEVLMLGLHS